MLCPIFYSSDTTSNKCYSNTTIKHDNMMVVLILLLITIFILVITINSNNNISNPGLHLEEEKHSLLSARQRGWDRSCIQSLLMHEGRHRQVVTQSPWMS